MNMAKHKGPQTIESLFKALRRTMAELEWARRDKVWEDVVEEAQNVSNLVRDIGTVAGSKI